MLLTGPPRRLLSSSYLLVLLLPALTSTSPLLDRPDDPGVERTGNERINLCPLASDIYPCQCTWAVDLSQGDLYCPNVESVEQLQEIFLTAFFPDKWFWRIRVLGGPLGVLPPDLFNDVRFDEVRMNSVNITAVHPDAFRASKSNMDTLELYSNQLTDESFPWSTLGEYTRLWRVHLHHNPFLTFPTLDSPALEDLNLWQTPITTFSRLDLQGAPNLRILEVNPLLTSFPSDAFVDLTRFEQLDLSYNDLGHLRQGQITLNSSSFDYLYLQQSNISTIDPDAITGVTSTRLYLYLEDNRLTRLEEAVFAPLMARMLDGWGALEVGGNPLVCDCDMYWLLSNATLLDNVRSGDCDGVPLSDVDISGWNC